MQCTLIIVSYFTPPVLYSSLLCFALLCSGWSGLLSSDLVCSALLYSTLPYPTLPYLTLPYPILLYPLSFIIPNYMLFIPTGLSQRTRRPSKRIRSSSHNNWAMLHQVQRYSERRGWEGIPRCRTTLGASFWVCRIESTHFGANTGWLARVHHRYGRHYALVKTDRALFKNV